VRLESVGTFIVTMAALLAVSEKGVLMAGVAGLSLTYALNVTQSFNWLVRMASDWESQVVSVERIAEYSQVPSEPPHLIEDARPPPDGPPMEASSSGTSPSLTALACPSYSTTLAARLRHERRWVSAGARARASRR